jgi:hypothetical protein
MYGDISARVAFEMRKPEVLDFYARLIQRVAPKSYAQAMGEVIVTRKFFENFGGDQVSAMHNTQPLDHPHTLFFPSLSLPPSLPLARPHPPSDTLFAACTHAGPLSRPRVPGLGRSHGPD